MADRDDRVFGDVGAKFLFENERVRVWKMDLEPSEYSDLHRHELDIVPINVAGDRIASCPEPDTESLYKEYVEADIFSGHTIFIPRGGVERAHNVGKEHFTEIIVELKDCRTSRGVDRSRAIRGLRLSY